MLHGIDPVFAVSGLAVGLFVGFTGVGGGSLMTPLLVLVFGVHPATAVGTDLLYAGLTKISGGPSTPITARSIGASRAGSPMERASGAVVAAAACATRVFLPGERRVISTTLGIALLLTAVTLIFRKALLARLARVYGRRERAEIRTLTIVLGAVLGVLVTIVRWRWRHRRHGSADALPEVPDRAHCRLRYRACGAADADRRRRALVARIRRLPYASFRCSSVRSRA